MHPNPIFRKETRQRNITFARERSFGTLAVNAEDGPLISHIPFQLSEDGHALEAHLVRSNPIARLLKDPMDAVIAVCGSDGYISPDWYGIDDQVPTWNYIAVHLRGTLRVGKTDELAGILDRLSASMETRLLPKPIWTRSKMSAGVFERMSRQIVPVFMEVETIDGTWKLSQNKPQPAPELAADRLRAEGFGLEIGTLSRLMKSAQTSE